MKPSFLPENLPDVFAHVWPETIVLVPKNLFAPSSLEARLAASPEHRVVEAPGGPHVADDYGPGIHADPHPNWSAGQPAVLVMTFAEFSAGI